MFKPIELLGEFELKFSTIENLMEKIQELIEGLKQHQILGEVKLKLNPNKCETYLNYLIQQWKENKSIDTALTHELT